MTEEDHAALVENQAFIANYMYFGRGSRRPSWQFAWMLAIGLFIILGDLWLYNDLAAWEADPNAEDRWENVFVVFLYEIGGKELVRAVGLGVGSLIIVAAVVGYAQARKVMRRGRG